jgi:RNA-directed DNA polymerase
MLDNEVRPLVERFLNERGLQLSPEKTRITHITEGFDFLGQHIRKYGDGKVVVKPSNKNTKGFMNKVREIVKKNASASQRNLIRQLNPVIRGWLNYHQHISAAQTFRKVDYMLWHILWQWARRRHPRKSGRWVIRKYWHPIGRRTWTFAADTGERTANGATNWHRLVYPADAKIRRHVKIRGEANPFDPRWRDYFEEREFFKKFGITRREAGITVVRAGPATAGTS